MTVDSVSDITSFKWGTVTATAPLAVRLDGDTAALALIPDSLVDPQELIVGDRVRVELSLRKVVIHGVANGGGRSGDVMLTARATAPNGWALCQGQAVARTGVYARLFAAIGTQYGTGDGSTTFNLPDLRGRVAVGLDTGQTEFNTLGKTGGAKTHSLAKNEMPRHQHNMNEADGGNVGYIEAGGSVKYNVGFAAARNNTGILTGFTGGSGSGTSDTSGQAHNNLQPYEVLNYIIKI